MSFTITTLAERPDMDPRIFDIDRQVWPPFMLEDPVADKLWHHLFDTFPEHQALFVDESGALVAYGHTIPIYWDGSLDTLPSGWDEVLAIGVKQHEQGITPNAMSALSAGVDPTHQGKGLSTEVIRAMAAVGVAHGYHSLIAPVRPMLKPLYPLIPIERYITWTRHDGLPFDPWIRVHARLGARILTPSPKSMYIPGTVAQWEEWSGIALPESGRYVVKGALEPITVNREADLAEYYEPNVWMQHTL